MLDTNIEDIISVDKQLNYKSEIRNHVDCTAKRIFRRTILEDRKARRNKNISVGVI